MGVCVLRVATGLEAHPVCTIIACCLCPDAGAITSRLTPSAFSSCEAVHACCIQLAQPTCIGPSLIASAAVVRHGDALMCCCSAGSCSQLCRCECRDHAAAAAVRTSGYMVPCVYVYTRVSGVITGYQPRLGRVCCNQTLLVQNLCVRMSADPLCVITLLFFFLPCHIQKCAGDSHPRSPLPKTGLTHQ